MTLKEILNWLSDKIPRVWDWVINVDLTKALIYFLGIIIVGLLTIVFQTIFQKVWSRYQNWLASLYSKYPKTMYGLYLLLFGFSIVGLLVFIVTLLSGFSGNIAFISFISFAIFLFIVIFIQDPNTRKSKK